MNVKSKDITHKSNDGLWELRVKFDSIAVRHLKEDRVYQLDGIIDVSQAHEYVTLEIANGSYYQVKFEEGSFLVIDEFDKDDEFVDSIGSHVFGENSCIECDFNMGEGYVNCGASEDGVCPECGTEN